MLGGACREQRDIFRKEWPDGADITIENVRRARELGLNLAWGEHWFIAPAWKAYDEAIVPAWKAYDEATAQARKAYREAITQAWEAYDEARDTARKAYREAIAPAWKAYDEAVATAWVAAYIASVAEREMQQ